MSINGSVALMNILMLSVIFSLAVVYLPGDQDTQGYEDHYQNIGDNMIRKFHNGKV